MKPQRIFYSKKIVSHRHVQSKTNLICVSNSADSLSLWKYKVQTLFSSSKMCNFLKKEGQKLVFHAATSSAKLDSKFDKYFSPKSKLNSNFIGFNADLRTGHADGFVTERFEGDSHLFAGRHKHIHFAVAGSIVLPIALTTTRTWFLSTSSRPVRGKRAESGATFSCPCWAIILFVVL